MERYRFIAFDEHRLSADRRDFPASGDEIAIKLAEGWLDNRSAELWRGELRVKQWKGRGGRKA